MRKQIFSRLLAFAVTLLFASIVVFCLLDLLPGNAAIIKLGTGARADTIAALEAQLGLDRPAWLRYLSWIGGAFTGDLGVSTTYGVPVSGLIAERLVVTLPLAMMALSIAIAIGVSLGVLAGNNAGGKSDAASAVLTNLGIAIPDFWFGILLIMVFSTFLHWMPAGGFPGWDDPVQAIRALLLPSISLALPQAAILLRLTRGAVIENKKAEHVKTAIAKGLSPRKVLRRHVVRNSLGSIVTIIGLQFSFLIAGAVLVESVFNLPGLGQLAYQSLAQRDLIVIRSVAILFAAIVIIVNLIVDLAYVWIDPRLKTL